jgi:hypothetical protein
MATCWLGGVDLEGRLNANKSTDCAFLQASQEILCRRGGMNEGIEEITTETYEGFPVELILETATAAALAWPFSGDTAGTAGTAGTLALASTTRWLRQ